MMANKTELAIFASRRQPFLKNTRRPHPSSLASVLSISSVLVMLALFLMVFLLSEKFRKELRENVSLQVFFHLDAPEEDIINVQKELESRGIFREIRYTSAADGLKEMTQELQQDIELNLGFNPIPASLELRLKSEFASQGQLASLKQELSANKLVREVSYPSGLLEQIESNSRRILTVIGLLAFVFALISITLINGTVRLGLYSQRFLIRSMQLVGARPWFIIRPFIARAIRTAFLATLISIPVLAGIAYWVTLFIPELINFFEWPELAVVSGTLLVSAVLLTVICSYFATRKYLKLKLEELY